MNRRSALASLVALIVGPRDMRPLLPRSAEITPRACLDWYAVYSTRFGNRLYPMLPQAAEASS